MSERKPLVSTMLGARPKAIKLAPLIHAFQRAEDFRTRVVLTGKNSEMESQVTELFDLGSGTLFERFHEKANRRRVFQLAHLQFSPTEVPGCTAKLIGTAIEDIVAEEYILLSNSAAYAAMARAHNLFGVGQDSGRIAAMARTYFLSKARGKHLQRELTPISRDQ